MQDRSIHCCFYCNSIFVVNVNVNYTRHGSNPERRVTQVQALLITLRVRLQIQYPKLWKSTCMFQASFKSISYVYVVLI